MIDKLVSDIADMREREALQTVEEMLNAGTDPLRILTLCRDAMSVVGDRFEKGEYFLPELVFAGEILNQISDTVKPLMRSQSTTRADPTGRVVIGTVRGDVHDIGKNIVAFMLGVNGFEVHDLGIDVPVEQFVEKIAHLKPEIVGLSGFLTVAFDAMRETIDGIQRAGLRDQVKIMIGGGMVDDHIRAYTGADAYGKDAIAAVALARRWTGGEQEAWTRA